MKKLTETISAGAFTISATVILTLLTATNARLIRAEEIDSVVASVDGEPITSQDLKNPAAGAAGGASGMASGLSMGTPDSPQGALKNAIEQKLLEQEANKYASKVDEDEVDRYIVDSM